MKIKYVVFFLLLPFWMQSQENPTIDSLKKQLKLLPQDTTRVRTNLKLCGEIRMLDAEKAIPYAEDALSLSHKLKWIRGKVSSNYMLGVCYYYLFDLEKGNEYLEEALKISIDNQYKDLLGDIYNMLGSIENENGNLESSISYYEKAVEVFEQKKDNWGLSFVLNNIGKIYFDLFNKSKAETYYKRALLFAEAQKDSTLITTICTNIYNANGDIKHLERAKSIAEKTQNTYNLLFVHQSFGVHFFEKNQYEQALENYHTSLDLAQQLDFIDFVPKLSNNISSCYIALRKFEQAEQFARKALTHAQQSNDLEGVSDASSNLTTIFYEHKNIDSLKHYADLYSLAKDSTFEKTLNGQIANFDSKYNAAQREQQITAQNLQLEQQKNTQNSILFGGLALLFLGGFSFLFYNQKQKQERQKAQLALQVEKERAENLEQLDQLKDQFFANISHELRTPLTLIKDPLEQVLKKQLQPAIQKDIELAADNSDKLLDLINEILDLAKLEAGKLPINENSLLINENCKRIFKSFQSYASSHLVDLQFESGISDELALQTDWNKLEKILNNLISNAIKFTQPKSSVYFNIKEVNQYLQLKIIDQGDGISDEELKHIFKRFYQVKNNQKGGTGIGLSFSKALATAIDAQLQVDSEIGQGSTFYINIPISKCQLSTTTTEESVTADSDAKIEYVPLFIKGQKPKILVVEDNTDLSKYILRLLSKDYDCTLAQDGAIALKLIQSQKFELIISDIMMPVMDGLQLRKELLETHKLGLTPFVFLTAKSLEDDILAGLRLGVDDYITKPFKSDELLSRVYNLISNQVKRDEWLKQNNGFHVVNPDEVSDKKMLKKLESCILENSSNSQFSVEQLAQYMTCSTRQLQRITKNLTGLSPVELILEIRLLQARKLLETNPKITVSEAQYAVGIEGRSYFSRTFKKRFGRSPSAIKSSENSVL